MAPLIVVTGPPGAGKSTVARHVAGAFERSVLVAGDEFFAFIAAGYIEPWLPASKEQNTVVIKAAAAAAGRFADGGYTVVYDGVLGPWFLEEFVTAAGVDRIDYVMLLPPQDSCLERVRQRIGHPFTDADATRHMYRQFEQSALDKRHVISNVGSPEEAADEVLKRLADAALLWKVGE